MSYITDPKGAQFGLFNTTTDASCLTMVGQRFHTEDGRQVVLFQNGVVKLDAGVLTQHSPIIADHQAISVVTYTAPNAQTGLPATLTATLGATKADENYYEGGFVVVNSGAGIGQTLRVTSSSPTASTGVITITLEDAPLTALTSGSNICLIAAPYTGVVISPTTPTAGVSGVTLYDVDASTANTYDGTSGKLTAVGTPVFGFMVVNGVTSCLSDVSVAAVGLGVSRSVTTPGAITVAAATYATIGEAYQGGVSAESRAITVAL